MPRTSSRQLIGAPVDRVFTVATLPERFPEWNQFVVTVANVSGPLTDAGAHSTQRCGSRAGASRRFTP